MCACVSWASVVLTRTFVETRRRDGLDATAAEATEAAEAADATTGAGAVGTVGAVSTAGTTGAGAGVAGAGRRDSATAAGTRCCVSSNFAGGALLHHTVRESAHTQDGDGAHPAGTTTAALPPVVSMTAISGLEEGANI